MTSVDIEIFSISAMGVDFVAVVWVGENSHGDQDKVMDDRIGAERGGCEWRVELILCPPS